MSGSRFTLPSWKAASMFLRLSSGTVRTPAAQISLVTATLFPEAYLETEVHEEGEYKGKKRREQVQAVRWCSSSVTGTTAHPLASSQDFLRRYHIGRRQSARGQLGQMAAVMCVPRPFGPCPLRALTRSLPTCRKHRVSADRLAKLASAVPHTAIIHGTDDNLIHVQRAHELHKDIPVRVCPAFCRRLLHRADSPRFCVPSCSAGLEAQDRRKRGPCAAESDQGRVQRLDPRERRAGGVSPRTSLLVSLEDHALLTLVDPQMRPGCVHSSPSVTRHLRCELRPAAVACLACAFARPFFASGP